MNDLYGLIRRLEVDAGLEPAAVDNPLMVWARIRALGWVREMHDTNDGRRIRLIDAIRVLAAVLAEE
jgi:hypothetical protein